MQEDIKNDVVKKPKSFLKERVMRFRIVVFIKKNIVVFTILLLFLFSLLLGLWNIRKFEIVDMDGGNLDSEIVEILEDYLKENVEFQNFFTLAITEIQEDMYSNISRLELVRIEKVLPNKLVVFVRVNEPKYVAYLQNQECYLLSKEGFVLTTLCESEVEEDIEETEDIDEDFNVENCCMQYALEHEKIMFSSNEVGISILENGRKKLLLMEDISKIVKVIEVSNYEVTEITLGDDILDFQEKEGRSFRFTLASDIDIQLKRYIIVLGKIRSDLLEFQRLDLRFERPVMND